MLVAVFLLSSIIILILTYVIGNNNERYWKKRGVKFYNKNKVTGIFWDFFTKDGALFQRIGDLYLEYRKEPAVGIGSITTPTLLVTNPKNVQHVLQADFSSFYHRGIEINKDDQLADNIVFMNGPRWKLMRQNMTPLFTATKLKSMYYIMDKSAHDFVEYLKSNPKTWDTGCFDTLMTFCNAAICGGIFGISSESIFDSPFLKMAKSVTGSSLLNDIKFSVMNLSPKLGKILGITLFKKYETFFISAMTNVIQERKKENVKRHDFADICISIQNNGIMKDATTGCELEPTYGLLTAQAMFFLVAGVEPVAIAMFSTFLELGSHPDILEKVHQEIDENFKKHGKNLTYDVITEMTYLDKVLSEAMRINPPIGYLTRQCVKDTVLPVGNIPVEKGTKILTPIYAIHHDPEVYPEPHVFNPERFAKDCNVNDEFYMPFGMGGRMCIGARFAKLQMAAGVVHILRHFTVKTKKIHEQVRFNRHFNNVRRTDVTIEFIPRTL